MISRRSLLTASALLASGCSGDTSVLTPTPAPVPAPVPSPPPVPVTWVVPQIVLAPGQSFDLAPTMPASVARNGRFYLHPTSPPLPSGVTMTPTGKINAASGAANTTTAGIIFGYDEP